MLGRYILYQAPGWLAIATVLIALHIGFDLSPWISGIIVLLLLAKDIVMYPVVRHAFAAAPHPTHARLVGRVVVAESGPGRSSYVRVDGELWQAATADDSRPIAPGSRGTVVGLRGLTLLVEPEAADRLRRAD